MGVSYFNNRRGIGQLKDITTHYNAGINMWNSPNTINDNLLSDSFEARLNTSQDAVCLGGRLYGASNISVTGTGNIVTAIDDADGFHLILVDLPAVSGNGVIDDWVKFSGGSTTTYDISAYGLAYISSGSSWVGQPSMCVLHTEAFTYVCLAMDQQKTLLIYDYTRFRTVTLPFYPKELHTHYNRIFAVDTGNKVWWCKAGDPFSWYGLEEDDDKIVTSTNMLDSGTYTIAAQPDVPRPLSITVTAVSTIDTLGTLAVVGTNSLAEAQSKTYTPLSGKYVTPDVWASVTSITASGHTAVSTVDTIKIGIAPLTGFVQADSGFWCIETEPSLTGLASIGGSLYIGSLNNIYCLSGYSYDTFALSKVISGVGELRGNCVVNNIAYFGHGNDIYEFDGESYPRIISRPVLVNGGVSNGIYGGVGLSDTASGISLGSDGDNLYYYNGSMQEAYDTYDTNNYYDQFYYYEFNIKSRTWWRRAGQVVTYPKTPSTVVNNVYYFSSYDFTSVFVFAYYYNSATSVWRYFTYTNETKNKKTYLVTKAFQDGVSNDLSLTEICLLCQSEYASYDTSFQLNVYYSLSTESEASEASDWTLIKSFTPANIGNLDNPLYELTLLSIPTVGSEVCRAVCYKLKIEWVSAYDLEIFKIERRYRVIRRSR